MADDPSEPLLLPEPVGWALGVLGVAYSLLHHQGFVLAPLGEVGATGTRWADWIDLATPYLVLVPAGVALALMRPGVGGRIWALFAVGALAYTQGHGIHLAANSVSNLAVDEQLTNRPLLDVVHLWDELMGHYLWYGGVTLVFVALVAALRRHRLRASRSRVVGAGIVAAAIGSTYATNALEGHFAWPALGVAVAMAVVLWVDRRRRPGDARTDGGTYASDLGFVGFVTAVLVLGFYGCWHQGFPDPSSVGWNPLAR